jgi:hypothetical protein
MGILSSSRLVFFLAFLATATEGLDIFFKIFLAIVVGQFFADFDFLFGIDQNFSSRDPRFAVRPAGMVDVPAEVFSLSSVNDPA